MSRPRASVGQFFVTRTKREAKKYADGRPSKDKKYTAEEIKKAQKTLCKDKKFAAHHKFCKQIRTKRGATKKATKNVKKDHHAHSHHKKDYTPDDFKLAQKTICKDPEFAAQHKFCKQ